MKSHFLCLSSFAGLHYCCCFAQLCARSLSHRHTEVLVCLDWLIIDLSLLSSISLIVLVAAMLWDCVFVFLVVDHSEKTFTNPKPKGRSCTITELHVLHSCLTFMAMWPLDHMKAHNDDSGVYSP